MDVDDLPPMRGAQLPAATLTTVRMEIAGPSAPIHVTLVGLLARAYPSAKGTAAAAASGGQPAKKARTE